MTINCCNLVGNFGDGDFTAKGVISITSKGDTPIQVITDRVNSSVTVAPSTGTVSITAYAGEEAHRGCQGSSNVSLNWVTRTNCDENIYMFGGAGRSNIQGNTGSYVNFPLIDGINNPLNEYEVVDVSSSSGPSSIYKKDVQKDGYGLIYTGNPWTIDTTNEEDCKINLTDYGISGTSGVVSYGECLLQSLNLSCIPGQIPTVSLSFIYSINNS